MRTPDAEPIAAGESYAPSGGEDLAWQSVGGVGVVSGVADPTQDSTTITDSYTSGQDDKVWAPNAGVDLWRSELAGLIQPNPMG